jgi:hypothetical protein
MFRDAGMMERFRVWLYALGVSHGAGKIYLCLFDRLDRFYELPCKMVTIGAWSVIRHA